MLDFSFYPLTDDTFEHGYIFVKKQIVRQDVKVGFKYKKLQINNCYCHWKVFCYLIKFQFTKNI